MEAFDILRGKKICVICSTQTIYDYCHEFNKLDREVIVIVCFKQGIIIWEKYSTFIPHFLFFNDGFEKSDSFKSKTKVYMGRKTNKIHDFKLYNLENKNDASFKVENEEIIYDYPVYEFSLLICFLSNFQPKSIFTLGSYYMSGNINYLEDDISHFFRPTPMTKDGYRSYLSLLIHGNNCLKKNGVDCFSIGERGCIPLKRTNFESIFLENPQEIQSISPDPLKEFEKRLDKKFYTSKFNLDLNLSIIDLFFHYFTDNFRLDPALNLEENLKYDPRAKYFKFDSHETDIENFECDKIKILIIPVALYRMNILKDKEWFQRIEVIVRPNPEKNFLDYYYNKYGIDAVYICNSIKESEKIFDKFSI